MSKPFKIFVLGLVSLILFPVSLWASLGGRESSIANDAAKLKAKRTAPVAKFAKATSANKSSSSSGADDTATVTSTTSYTVHEMTQNSLAVKEYLSTEGIVFAVTWKGALNPDLSLLLGTYNSDYEKAFAESRRAQDRHHVAINTNDLIVSRRGRAPNLEGVAYVPSLLPAGVQPGDLQ